MDKSWDHPWSTDEMRKKRREWSLAGDAGLLKHLQQFSENLTSRTNKTRETLDSLQTQLNETAIFIDNVTNTSLALANTQFIESRVEEDNIQIEKHVEPPLEESKDQESATADFIANVSESVKQGLNIMYEKYKEMEFEDSDSEEEDDNKVILSVVLGANNPYQDRPLPYVIGSEKWNNSSKIGLGSSSSSESEHIDEEEESETEDDHAAFKDFNMDAPVEPNTVRLLSSMNEPDYSRVNDIPYMGPGKIDTISQNIEDSVTESNTPNDNISKAPLPNNLTPNFAEELAKRLGTVRQAQKPAVVDEKSEASINRYKDDVFTAEDDQNASTANIKSISNKSKGFLNDESSKTSWAEKPIKSYKNNIIPASIDLPPPISTISTKPKSAIDDLFADADSEDSDDIFSSKNTVKTVTKNKHCNNSNQLANVENEQKKHLEIVAPTLINNIATSTPESNANTSNLFSDDEDVGHLFSSSKNQPPNRKKPVGGVSILGSILSSDMENKLSKRISRTQSTSGSSDSNTPASHETDTVNKESIHDNSRWTCSNDNVTERNSIATPRNNTENVATINESSSSSGISIHPSSINNTEGSSLGVDFQPQMTSTRLRSEEIYRERVVSDSLFTAHTRNPANGTEEESIENISSIRQDDVFDSDDLFGPPPLPKANTKTPKSKVSSLFDDSDSGDELFSTPSSGSRSQKSSDFLTTTSQHSDKSKLMQRRGLFDEEIDIFSNKDSPEVDIFGTTQNPSVKEGSSVSSRKLSDVPDDDLFGGNVLDRAGKSNDSKKSENPGPSRKIGLFDDEDVDDGDLFTQRSKTENKTDSRVFNDDYEGDLFSVKKSVHGNQNDANQLSGLGATGIDRTDQTTPARKIEEKESNVPSVNQLFSTTSHGLIFEDEDYDGLFGNTAMEKSKGEDELLKSDTKVDTDIKQSPVKSIEIPDDSLFLKPDEPNVSKAISDTQEKDNEKNARNVHDEEHFRTEIVANKSKKSPPKSLDVRTSSPPSENNSQGSKRVVSGKIKNLMGKMGDFKILSPMDAPPLWRKSDEKTDEEDSTIDRDSNDGGCVSSQGRSSPLSLSEDSTAQKQSQQSTISGGSNVESAISFDEPAQVETLSTTASKTRVRIQAKRRPQSRQARKSAIRQSGIDFDTVDNSQNNEQDENQANQSSSTSNKGTSAVADINTEYNAATSSDRLASCNNDNARHIGDSSIYLTADDKSEIASISKESSMSVNKNTLLSPSTDEEDLFDVPPDLPEDPQKEDTLFGRAPILSPVDKIVSERVPVSFKPLRDTHIQQIDDVDTSVRKDAQNCEKSRALPDQSIFSDISVTTSFRSKDFKQESTDSNDEPQELTDPLRNDNHDPLKDPSQLFAFVTKTPSPEKGKNVLFPEDDSLFSSGSRKISEGQMAKKSTLDLFADDSDGDLFSTSLVKPVVKKSLMDIKQKISLFDEDDEDESLFGPIVKKSSAKSDGGKKQTVEQPPRKINLFDDDNNDTNLFSDTPESAQMSESESIRGRSVKSELVASVTEPVRTSHTADIFADQSSLEEDIFGAKPITKKPAVTSKSLFPSDDEDNGDNIFGTKSTKEPQVKPNETRAAGAKKSVTRDLRKTAEKIAEDPLSVLLDE